MKLFHWIFPRKKWMITWGNGFARWHPKKELRWFWLGDPCTIMIDGCGPYPSDKIDSALETFLKKLE